MGFIKSQKAVKDLHWSRAQQDGAPFRGEKIPLLKEEEAQQLLEKVIDSKIATFDTTKPEQRFHGRTYQEVLDGITGGWFKLLAPRQFKWADSDPLKDLPPRMFVYVEWGEAYMEFAGESRDYVKQI